MVFVKHNSLKSDIFFNPIFFPGFSGSMFFRVQVFQSPSFSGSRFFRVQVQGPGPGSRVQGPGYESRVWVQGSGSGSRVHVQISEVALFYNKTITLQNTLNKIDCKLIEAMESSLIENATVCYFTV